MEIAKIEKLRKWLNARRGRTLIMANMLKIKKTHLYKLVNENRVSGDLLATITEKQALITKLERICIEKYKYLNRFVKRGQGRVPRLAQELKMPTHKVRRLLLASGDSRFQLISIGINKVMNAVTRVERHYARYANEPVSLRTILTSDMKRKKFDLKGIENVAGEVRENANFGDHDAAVFFKSAGAGKYRIISVGFDYEIEDACKSHICNKDRHYMHAITVASFKVPKEDSENVGELCVFVTTAPCPVCADRLLKLGVSKVYCYFEPELMDGLHLLQNHGVPVFKINIVTREETQINSELIQDAA